MTETARKEMFQPNTRGDLREALARRNGLHLVAPESPRPVEMLLTRVSLDGSDALTADDEALYDMLISLAYADDKTMTAETTAIKYGRLIKYLGGRHKRVEVQRALERLETTRVRFGFHWGSDNRRFARVPLLTSWDRLERDDDVLEYTLPRPIRALMATQSEYAYLELAALPRMESKYSSRLYRVLAWTARKRKWKPGGENRFSLSHTPEQLADLVGFPRLNGKLQVGKLRERFITKIESDFADVRAFTVRVRCEHAPKRRGNPLVSVVLDVDLSPPSQRAARNRVLFRRVRNGDAPRVGGKDSRQYQVDSLVWRRARKAYREVLGLATARDMFELWVVALDEALDGAYHTVAGKDRKFRGDRLLDAIRKRGANEAAWAFISEEADSPDLAPHDGGTTFEEHTGRIECAERRRMARAFPKADKPKPEAASVSAPEAIRRPPPRPGFLDRRNDEPVAAPVTAKVVAAAPSMDWSLAAKTLSIGECAVLDDGATVERIGPHTTVLKSKPKPVSDQPKDVNPRRWALLTADEQREEMLAWLLKRAPEHTITDEEIDRREVAMMDDPFDDI